MVIITLLLCFRVSAISTPTQSLPDPGTRGLSKGTPAPGGQGGAAHLGDEEPGEALRQPAFLAGQDHLQHVSVQLLHHHEHLLGRLEHALQVHDPRVPQTLGCSGGRCGGQGPGHPQTQGPWE